MRLLFVKDALAWPRWSGHDLHCFHMMRALAELGHEVALATVVVPMPEALAGLRLAAYWCLADVAQTMITTPRLRLTRLQERFRSYWGIERTHICAVAHLAGWWQADAVVTVGLNVLPYLAGIHGARRVWYAADEWAWHHLSLVRASDPPSWHHVRLAVVKGLYERVYAPLLDRAWVVSIADRLALRCVTGMRRIDVLPNGVDAEHYVSTDLQPSIERSCVFWGRLDFGPNIQAIKWFCRRVWPAVRRVAPDARLTLYGHRPSAEVRALAADGGIALVPDVADLRPEVGRHAVVILPFVSGGGIKNKLLEAASMGKPILCTPRACGGLARATDLPLVIARGPRAWVRELLSLWGNPERRQRLGSAARRWVLTHHTWANAARRAVTGLEQSLRATVT
jgi:glycosyltransferase involved in cell wall biosynthesis